MNERIAWKSECEKAHRLIAQNTGAAARALTNYRRELDTCRAQLQAQAEEIGRLRTALEHLLDEVDLRSNKAYTPESMQQAIEMADAALSPSSQGAGETGATDG